MLRAIRPTIMAAVTAFLSGAGFALSPLNINRAASVLERPHHGSHPRRTKACQIENRINQMRNRERAKALRGRTSQVQAAINALTNYERSQFSRLPREKRATATADLVLSFKGCRARNAAKAPQVQAGHAHAA